MREKHLRKSNILSKNTGQSPARLLKMLLFQLCFSNIFLVQINNLVSPSVNSQIVDKTSKPVIAEVHPSNNILRGKRPSMTILASEIFKLTLIWSLTFLT